MPTSSPASPIHGVCPVLATPFRADGAPDAAALARVVEFAIAAGAHAVVYPGVASEVEQLADAERDRLLDALAAAVRGRVPVIAGASATDAGATLRHLEKAKQLGAAAAMVMARRALAATSAH
jgi:4-hydroxy-tetrahydrodipicolinate synthase